MPRWLADTVTRRLGVEQLTIDTSHSPFLSRPKELAELLVHATHDDADRPARTRTRLCCVPTPCNPTRAKSEAVRG